MVERYCLSLRVGLCKSNCLPQLPLSVGGCVGGGDDNVYRQFGSPSKYAAQSLPHHADNDKFPQLGDRQDGADMTTS